MNEYQTKNLPVAAYLVCLGRELKRLDPIGNNRSYFVFERDDQIESDVDKYWSGTMVDPQKFWDAVRTVKNKIYEGIER